MMHKDIKKHYIQAFSAIFFIPFFKKKSIFRKKSTHNVKECSNYQANSSLIARTPYLYMAHAHPSSTYNNQQHNSHQRRTTGTHLVNIIYTKTPYDTLFKE